MTSPVARSYRNYLLMDEPEPKNPALERIRFDVQDEEAAVGGVASSRPSHGRHGSRGGRPSLARSSTAISEDSVSLRPGSRGSMTIEPAAALPIQYRTL